MANPYGYDEESVYRRGAPAPGGVAGMHYNLAEQASRALGDPERSYGGGQLNLNALRAAEAVRAGGTPELPKDQYGNTIIGTSVDQMGKTITHTVAPGGDIGAARKRLSSEGGTLSSPYRIPEASKAVLEAGQGILRPIHVIRGVTSTYAGGEPGLEYLSSSRAAQAINRFLGVGEYVPSETARAEALSLRDPFKKAEAEALEGSRARGLFEQKLLGEFGVPDKDDPNKLVLPDYVQKLAYRYMPTRLAEIDKAVGDIKMAVRPEILGTKSNRERMYQNYLTALKLGMVQEMPNAKEVFLQRPITPETMGAMEEWLNWRPPGQKREPTIIPSSPAGETPGSGKALNLTALRRTWEELPAKMSLTPPQYVENTGLATGLQALSRNLFGTPEQWREAHRMLQEEESHRVAGAR